MWLTIHLVKALLPDRRHLTIDEVWEIYRNDLYRVEEQIKKDLRTYVPLIDAISNHLFQSGGKRFRPLLLILTAYLTGYEGNAHIELASVIELIHTATLLHDDVIDEAHIRRGRKTARMIWGNQASILVGDYLYTKAQCRIVSFHNHELNEIIADTTRRLTQGELSQLSYNGDISITEEDYLDIIGNKTASLISAACRIGALLGNCTEAQKKGIEEFGWNVGIAFQLADDTLDYIADKGKLGKSICKDLQEGKITLPLLALLKRCSKEEFARIEKIIQDFDFTEENLKYILDNMKRYGVIEYSLNKAREYIDRAKKGLSLFNNSIHLQALSTLADYVVEREL